MSFLPDLSPTRSGTGIQVPYVPLWEMGKKICRGQFTTECAESAEKTVMREVYLRIAAAILCILEEGIAAAMNKYN